MEKSGNYSGDRGRDLLEQAEKQNMKKHREEVAERMGRIATREILQSEKTESGDDAIMAELLSDYLSNTNSKNTETNPEEMRADEANEDMKRATEIMRELIRDNFVGAVRKYRSLEARRDGCQILYEGALRRSYNGISSRNNRTDEIAKNIPDFEDAIQELSNSSPEAYTAIHGSELRENIKNRDDGWMMETPYVKEHMDRLVKNMNMGKPTFIHGHLGSGKTELAITAAKEFMISRAAKSEAIHRMIEYKNNHEVQNNEELVERLGKFYQRSYDSLKKRAAEGDSDEFSPLIVSGSGDMTTADLFLDKSLKLTKYNGTDTAGHKDQYDETFEKWKESHQKNYEGLSDEERTAREAKDSEEFFKLYVAEHQAYGTEVEMIAKPLLQAIEEGRPIILDEVNAIPTAVLISLNDILQRRPGDTCYVPGRGQVEIQDGFSITMTANLSTNSVDYGGTNDLNPAFLSRPDVFEYSYLPQNESGRLDEQEDMPKNQLFQVMITYLTDRQGNLELPEIDESVDKLFRLAQFAHQTQQIFAGKNIESASYASQSGDEVDVKLDNSVLSVRNVLRVLEKWNKGESMDLDKALWEGFISGIVDAEEQHAFLKLAQNYGFFSKQSGWKLDAIKQGALVNFEDIYPEKYEFMRSPMEVYTMTDTVNLIYGNGPEREFYPEFTFDAIEEEGLEDLSGEEFEMLENSQEELTDAIGALEVLAEQCGCDNFTTEE